MTLTLIGLPRVDPVGFPTFGLPSIDIVDLAIDLLSMGLFTMDLKHLPAIGFSVCTVDLSTMNLVVMGLSVSLIKWSVMYLIDLYRMSPAMHLALSLLSISQPL